jgi:ribA/ribD-fused uncharacterized protein
MIETETHLFIKNHKTDNSDLCIYHSAYPCTFIDYTTDKTYKSLEQWMIEQRALFFDDFSLAKMVMNETNLNKIMSYKKKIMHFDQTLWDTGKFEIAIKGTYLKFSQNLEFSNQLKNTGTKIVVRVNANDSVWGIALSMKNIMITQPIDWPGQNLSGKVLMIVRNMV